MVTGGSESEHSTSVTQKSFSSQALGMRRPLLANQRSLPDERVALVGQIGKSLLVCHAKRALDGLSSRVSAHVMTSRRAWTPGMTEVAG